MSKWCVLQGGRVVLSNLTKAQAQNKVKNEMRRDVMWAARPMTKAELNPLPFIDPEDDCDAND